MPITITCRDCGKRFQAKDEAAGKRVRCPGCGHGTPVPAQNVVAAAGATAPGGQEYRLEEHRQCPECKHEWPKDAVVCIDCGYDFRSGQKLKRKYKVSHQTGDFGVRFLGTYTRYDIGRDREGELVLSQSDWLLFIPCGTKRLRLRGYDTVVTSYSHIYKNSEFCTLVLEGAGKRPLEIYSGKGQAEMKWLLDALQQVAGMTVKRD